MAPAPHWKGYLKLSLVTCPVQMLPATTENEKVRFRTLNRETGNPVVSQYVDSVTGKRVRSEDEVKGYEIGEGHYVMLEDGELSNVALETTRTIDIEMFVPRSSIPWIWLDSPYYLSVENPVGLDAFSVIRDAMAAEEMIGISRLVISRRERAVMIEPRGKGIVLWTLRYGDEVRDKAEYFSGIGTEEVGDDIVPLVDQFIKQETQHWSPAMVADPIQKKLLKLVEMKRKLQHPTPIKTKPTAPGVPRPKVVNLMDALRKSMEADAKKSKTRPPGQTH
ncbi:Ku protein [Pararhizobium sp. BT-229]|uniref:non-homologous end joining protein Ku n=1 Tax=Pararhizobium sp. BT-229 TaxID=2986923 RepID=UPI0021F6C373|nr:Ku protein [Pararhizobium sp. BT-229]MCV9964776.1 Ku protein [Pararhizobium sp. BT-229]